MKNFIIFCPAEKINKDKIILLENSIKIAADSGIGSAFFLGATPDILAGDFDSFPFPRAAVPRIEKCEIIRHPSEKDDTDLMLAVKLALERGAGNIQIIGGMYGRIDHTLANLMLLRYICDNGCAAHITDGYNRVRLIKDGSVSVERLYKYISLIPVGGDLEHVYMRGFKYALEDAEISMNMPVTVSNEFAEGAHTAEIAVKGTAFLCECDDML